MARSGKDITFIARGEHLKAMKEKGLTAEFYLYRRRTENEIFPWDAIDIGVKRTYLYEELRRAETEQDFAEIRAELRQSGFLRAAGKSGAASAKAHKEKTGRPREFRTRSGFTVWVGRSNRQNDAITKSADRGDIWLHTQKIHGSHVILCTDGRAPTDSDITEAASVAAWWSQARDGDKVPVDYTPVRYVKKPSGARPGMVVYTTYRTVYVAPKEL